ncbi:hypothetical protein AZL_020540 [Azospirillum sp. B510]|uniref:hypothetical protein n=1 Tax=Azospirillum sp. (strain B510) TaxID=137722 RepID=UPI0001C4C2E9|nr:hypothetical protein [Azospirillum sp. B510]BAI71459.1 hypothetical protein AZL_008210 [Azospirillum sp. B510]BAI72692.1 hypothetical protein AZL_020540 [Azospirillum sp. B510]
MRTNKGDDTTGGAGNEMAAGDGRLGADTSLIPALGMTVREAVEAVRRLFAEHETDETVATRWMPMIDAILATTPHTVGDTMAILDQLLCPETGLPSYTTAAGKADVTALSSVRAFLAGIQVSHQIREAAGIPCMEAAFAAEAPAMLNVPAVPADRLLEAAAVQAGITTEQARLVYDAMMAPFLGRAA